MKAKKLFLAAAVLATAFTFTLSCAGSKPAAYPEGAYVETGGGFLVVPPDGWEIMYNSRSVYKAFLAPNEEDGFVANVNFLTAQENISFETFVNEILNEMQSKFNSKIIRQEDFKTAKGLKGKKLVITMEQGEKQYRLAYYIFPREEGSYMVATAGSLASSGDKYDAAFDKSMKTFEWIKVEKSDSYSYVPGGPYVEKGEGGFSVVPPKTWDLVNSPALKYKIFMSSNEADSNANMNFISEQSNLNFDAYVQNTVDKLQLIRTIISQEDFKTAKGLEAKKLIMSGEIKDIKVRQIVYFIPNGKGLYMVVSCTSASSMGEKFDAVFDESMRTFEWIE